MTNAGTIPDRGLFGVFLPDGTRVGELDEEMVYESRPGDAFLLGASTWRIQDITHDRVLVTPAPGEPGKMPFWHGDKPGRPLELGRAVGAFLREVQAPGAEERLRTEYGLDGWAASNLVQYVAEQAEAAAVPNDRTVVVERFRDEIGDWRICLLSPFGSRVHAPWAMAIEARLRQRLDMDVQTMWSDDGIVLRLPETEDHLPLEELLIDPDDLEDLVLTSLPDTAMFASRFRENAARALLLPRRKPGGRTPLWQQRQRSAGLLQVAAKHPSFPILLETTRECLADVFDLPALQAVLGDLRSRTVRLVSVDTATASPFASSLLFGWVGAYMYEGDAPLAERRATALSLDRELLAELLGAGELRELLDPGVLATLELELQMLVEGRRAPRPGRGPRRAAPARRPRRGRAGRALGGRRRRRGGLGGPARGRASGAARRGGGASSGWRPPRTPPACVTASASPYRPACRRRSSNPSPGPSTSSWPATPAPTGPSPSVLPPAGLGQPPTGCRRRSPGWRRRVGSPPGSSGRGAAGRSGWTRRSSGSSAVGPSPCSRREVEPVDASTLGRFLPAWHGIGEGRRGLDALADAIGRLQGAAVPASVLEADVLAARVAGYRPADLDELCAAGEVVWLGAGAIGATDGRVSLHLFDQVRLLAPRRRTGDHRRRGPSPAPRGAAVPPRRPRRLVLAPARGRRRRRRGPGRGVGAQRPRRPVGPGVGR